MRYGHIEAFSILVTFLLSITDGESPHRLGRKQPHSKAARGTSVCQIVFGGVPWDVSRNCRQFLNQTGSHRIWLTDVEPACNIPEISGPGLLRRTGPFQYQRCEYGEGVYFRPQKTLTCLQLTITVGCLSSSPEIAPSELRHSNQSSLAVPVDDGQAQSLNMFSKTIRKRREIDFASSSPMPDFLEVPVSSKRKTKTEVPDPVVVMILTSYDRELGFGDTTDIGGLLTVRLRVDGNASGVYGISLQSLDATDGGGSASVEPLVHDGCPTTTFVAPTVSQINRSLVDITFRVFRFPGGTTVKLIATVHACIQRCPRIHCGKKSQRHKRGSVINTKNSTSTTTTMSPGLSEEPSIRTIRRKSEYELVLVTSVEVRGYNKKFIVGLRGRSRSSAQHQPSFYVLLVAAVIIKVLVSIAQ